MNVKLAVLADYANVSKEGKLNIMGIFDVIHAQQFPYTHPQMQFVMNLEATLAEAGKTKKVEVHLMDGDGKKLFVVNGDLALGQARPGEPFRTSSILTINLLKLDQPGDYVFNVLINDEHKARVPLKVVRLASSSTPPLGASN